MPVFGIGYTTITKELKLGRRGGLGFLFNWLRAGEPIVDTTNRYKPKLQEGYEIEIPKNIKAPIQLSGGAKLEPGSTYAITGVTYDPAGKAKYEVTSFEMKSTITVENDKGELVETDEREVFVNKPFDGNFAGLGKTKQKIQPYPVTKDNFTVDAKELDFRLERECVKPSAPSFGF